MKTFVPKQNSVENKWFVVNAEGKTLGRLATQLAIRLRGKHKPEFTPFMDTGDYLVVINAEKVKVTGTKTSAKVYHHHSGYPGGIKARTYTEMLDKAPERILEIAVKGMLPKGPLGRQIYSKLKVYAGTAHPHQAQNPEPLEI